MGTTSFAECPEAKQLDDTHLICDAERRDFVDVASTAIGTDDSDCSDIEDDYEWHFGQELSDEQWE